MKLRKIITMGLAALMAVSAMSVSAFAAENDKYGLEYSAYDSDMIYVQKDADWVAEYNANLQRQKAITRAYWDWSYGICSMSSSAAGGLIVPYYFIPASNYLYFNVEIKYSNSTSVSASTGRLTVNKYDVATGNLTYVGSYNITKKDENTLNWTNYKRTLTSGQPYCFSILSDSTWNSAIIDIYKSSM